MISPNSDEYIISVDFPIIMQNIDKFLKPQNRGFELTYSGAVSNYKPSILYQSKQCQIRISCMRDRPYEDVELSFLYGRLHAPIDRDILAWNKEMCWCWHRVDAGSPLLSFLDGLSPADAEKLRFPEILGAFFESSKNMSWSVPEFMARKHAMIWEHYDQRFFNLFDVGYPYLWEEYVNFLKEYSRLRQEKDNSSESFIYQGLPFRYKIC